MLVYGKYLISCLVNAFSEILKLKRSLKDGQQLQQKERKKRKGGSERKTRIKDEKPKVVGSFDFYECLSKKVVERDSREMKGRPLRFKGRFN